MLDMFHLSPPTSKECTVQKYGGNTPYGVATGYFTWNKPRGAAMCHFLVVGPGGCGGAGFVGAASAAGGGGGGGGGALFSGIFPAYLIPDKLHMFIGETANQDTGNGRIEVNIFNPNAIALAKRFIYCPAGANASAGTIAAGGGGGGGGTAVVNTTAALINLALFYTIGGQAGSSGGFNGNGVNLAVSASSPMSGGTGGGGIEAVSTGGGNGGAITVAGNPYVGTNGGNGGTNAPTNGSDGCGGNSVMDGLIVGGGGTGGGGGGLSVAAGGNGGRGGNGQPGCGGGGGGASFTGGVAGGRGSGGYGFIIVTSW